jgi:hypothetical protein
LTLAWRQVEQQLLNHASVQRRAPKMVAAWRQDNSQMTEYFR